PAPIQIDVMDAAIGLEPVEKFPGGTLVPATAEPAQMIVGVDERHGRPGKRRFGPHHLRFGPELGERERHYSRSPLWRSNRCAWAGRGRRWIVEPRSIGWRSGNTAVSRSPAQSAITMSVAPVR